MWLKVSGQHITGDTAEASGNICCDTWLQGHTHDMRSRALLNMHIFMHLHLQTPSTITLTLRLTHTVLAVGWRRLTHGGMCSLLKYSQCESIFSWSVDHHVTEWKLFTDYHCEVWLMVQCYWFTSWQKTDTRNCAQSPQWVKHKVRAQGQLQGSMAHCSTTAREEPTGRGSSPGSMHLSCPVKMSLSR